MGKKENKSVPVKGAEENKERAKQVTVKEFASLRGLSDSEAKSLARYCGIQEKVKHNIDYFDLKRQVFGKQTVGGSL